MTKIAQYVALAAAMQASQMAEPQRVKPELPLPKHNSGCGSSNNQSGKWSEKRKCKEIKRRRKQKRLNSRR